MDSPSYSFFFWNARSIMHKLSDLKQHAKTEHPMIIGICETWLTPNLTISFNGYKTYRADRTNRQGGGLLLLIHNSLASAEFRIQRFPGGVLETLAVRISLPSGWATIFISYNPCLDVTTAEYTHYLTQLPTPSLIMADFNARHTHWQPDLPRSSQNSSGHALFQALLTSPSFVLLTPPGLQTRIDPYTCKHSTLDLCLGSGHFTEVEVSLGHYMGSDHLPVIVSVPGDPPPPISLRPRWLLNTGNWSNFIKTVTLNLPAGTEDINTATEQVTSQIINAGTNTFTKSSGQYDPHPKVPWWNDNCETAVKQRRRAWNKWKKCPCLQHQSEYRRLDAIRRRTVNPRRRPGLTTAPLSTSAVLHLAHTASFEVCLAAHPSQHSHYKVQTQNFSPHLHKPNYYPLTSEYSTAYGTISFQLLPHRQFITPIYQQTSLSFHLHSHHMNCHVQSKHSERRKRWDTIKSQMNSSQICLRKNCLIYCTYLMPAGVREQSLQLGNTPP